ncbi:LLM class flavin-dependent oxidoreductase [Pseudoclavibacter chungangensis]|uniref:LLM class flavin-dependent oxidoreductase n=1 Tax=Pseudoclavibacter chungangensis TaxID=587635 RepID=A0A7J5BYJ0_9MICO|nr:LLM class flavin-dependent oxidoreductase [Pseudoclavibacter chungangensis]KAB1659419.1 LLM class flavin-dependent oxidoreductase [Pseudoclavibacter chungangensis]NYJ67739.1 FMN-dependent oxidoreductase (nitrilotriacetate monooxygenase family) [Pseudoclavibacter chungangensis]
MPSAARQIHLALFALPHGQLASSWRLPEIPEHSTNDFDEYRQAADIIERAKFDAFFIADKLTIGSEDSWRYGPPVDAFEPFTLGGALAAVTERLGVVATASTTFQHPYLIARSMLALDHLSRGRAGWNIVTSYSPDTVRNFGLDEHLPHDERYEIAEEAVDVVRRLWCSWDEDAVVWDREAGLYTRPGSVHAIDHVGAHFRVSGPGEFRRSVQGEPVRVQAGSSGRGMTFAATRAEMVFTAQTTLESGVAFAEELRERARQVGRRDDELVIMPGFSYAVGSSDDEARRIADELVETVQPEHILGSIRDVVQLDLREYPLDGPVPELPDPATVQGHRSRLEVYKRIAETESLTLRDFARRVAAQRGHHQIVGSPERIADDLQRWFESGAADGFNVMPHTIPGQLRAFAEHVVPILQERGLFRREYEGTTLREHLGVPYRG